MRVPRRPSVIDVLAKPERPRISIVPGGGGNTPYVTSLPDSPADGDEIYFGAGQAGVIWHLRYRAGAFGSYKWEFVGGSPLVASRDTQRSTTSTAYVNLIGPMSIALPALAGDFDIRIEANIYGPGGASNASLSYQVGWTLADDSWSIVQAFALAGVSDSKSTRHTGVASGAVITEKARVSAGTGQFAARRLRVTPVRVG